MNACGSNGTPARQRANLRSHGVSFAEASSVFGDPLAGTVFDPDHSEDEPRFITIGQSTSRRLVVVVHTERADAVRIISARPATRHEKKKYEASERNQ